MAGSSVPGDVLELTALYYELFSDAFRVDSGGDLDRWTPDRHRAFLEILRSEFYPEGLRVVRKDPPYDPALDGSLVGPTQENLRFEAATAFQVLSNEATVMQDVFVGRLGEPAPHALLRKYAEGQQAIRPYAEQGFVNVLPHVLHWGEGLHDPEETRHVATRLEGHPRLKAEAGTDASLVSSWTADGIQFQRETNTAFDTNHHLVALAYECHLEDAEAGAADEQTVVRQVLQEVLQEAPWCRWAVPALEQATPEEVIAHRQEYGSLRPAYNGVLDAARQDLEDSLPARLGGIHGRKELRDRARTLLRAQFRDLEEERSRWLRRVLGQGTKLAYVAVRAIGGTPPRLQDIPRPPTRRQPSSREVGMHVGWYFNRLASTVNAA